MRLRCYCGPYFWCPICRARRRCLSLVVVCFFLSVPAAFAQVEIVAKYRALYPTPMSAEQHVALLRGVATEVHGGLLKKPDGNSCLGYSCDRICFSETALFDVLEKEEAEAIPRWNADTNPRHYQCELVTAAPEPPPVVVTPPPVVQPPPALVIDYDRLAAIVTAVVQADGEKTRAAVDNPAWITRVLGNRYVQLVLAAVTTYLTTRELTK